MLRSVPQAVIVGSRTKFKGKGAGRRSTVYQLAFAGYEHEQPVECAW